MKKFFLLLVFFPFAFTSCKKDKKDPDCSLTEANLVGSYKVTAVKYKASASAAEIDGSPLIFTEDCERDDILTFNADHTVAFTDAGIACTPNNSDTGNWGLTGNVITVDGDPGTLENFNCSGFTVVGVDVLATGDRIAVTYAKQ